MDHAKDLKTNSADGHDNVERLRDDCVLIAGGGPVGLVLATTLAFYGVKSIILERNQSTTKWPKMDLTNARSMEMFRRLGLAEGLRKQGVLPHFPYTVRISTGLNEEECITQWDLPSVNEYKERISKQNDGTLPLEPYQRLSQAVFEAWLKRICDENPLIDARFGWKVESIEELQSSTELFATDMLSGKRKTFVTKYLAGCDGASSKIRRNLDIPLEGGPVPGYSLLIHFKSRDLSRLHRQGQFWHIFFLDEGPGSFRGAIIAQNEEDTWTTHLQMPLDMDASTIDSHDAIYTVLGGEANKYQIKVDEILVRSTYRPSIAVAQRYSSRSGLVHLAGDAAHQNIPTGGYGMNLGLADAFDLGWKLAGVISGRGGPGLLSSYERDRRPVAVLCIGRSGVHMDVHRKAAAFFGANGHIMQQGDKRFSHPKELIHEHYQMNDGENKDLGIEMGYRYKSPICIPDIQCHEPEWVPSRYIPSTWPGSRGPHVFLKDGTPIFDLYGQYFSLVDFSPNASDSGAQHLLDSAGDNDVPLEHIRLVDEEHAHQLWEKNLVIVRPDGHVSWRANSVADRASADEIIRVIAGLHGTTQELLQNNGEVTPKQFSSTIGATAQTYEYELEKMGEFQK